MTISIKNQWLVFFSLLGILLVAWLTYWPSLNAFSIQEYNYQLETQPQYKGVGLWQHIWLYFLEGQLTPLNKPVSLSILYQNTYPWSASPHLLIYNNILLHLMNGLLVFWLLYRIAKVLGIHDIKLYIFSLLGTGIWLLHPMHSNTILDALQRNTEWSGVFVLLGLISYVSGRQRLSNGLKWGYSLMSAGTLLCLLFSVIVSELGVLLLFYVIVLEVFLLTPLSPVKHKRFICYQSLFFYLPAVLIIFSIMILSVYGEEGHESLLEKRFFSEAQYIFESFYYTFLPYNAINAGVGSVVLEKVNIFSFQVIFYTFFVYLMLFFAVFIRSHYPIIAFAIAWFILSHLVGSLIMPYEEYYTYRDYLGMFGLLFPISYYLIRIRLANLKVAYSMSLVGMAILVLITTKNSLAWNHNYQNPHNLNDLQGLTSLAKLSKSKLQHDFFPSKPVTADKTALVPETVESSVNNEQVLFIKASHGRSIMSLNIMDEPELEEEHAYPANLLKHLISLCRDTLTSSPVKQLQQAISVWNAIKVPASINTAMDQFLGQWNEQRCAVFSHQNILEFFNTLYQVRNEEEHRDFFYLVHFWLAEIYQDVGDESMALAHLQQAYELKPNLDMLMIQANFLIQKKRYWEVNNLLTEFDQREMSFRQRLIVVLRSGELEYLKTKIQRLQDTKPDNVALSYYSGR